MDNFGTEEKFEILGDQVVSQIVGAEGLPAFIEKNLTPAEKTEIELVKRQTAFAKTDAETQVATKKGIELSIRLGKKYAKTQQDKEAVKQIEDLYKTFSSGGTETTTTTPSSNVSFYKKVYYRVPVWGWGVIGVGVVMGGYHIYKAFKKSSYGY